MTMPWPVWALAIDGSTMSSRPWLGPIALDHAGEERLVLAVDRSDQRAAAARDQPGGLLLVAIGHDGCGGAEDLDLVHRVRRPRRTSSCSKVGATNADLPLSMPSSAGASAPPHTIDGFGRQAPDAVERGGLLAARHHRAHAGVGLRADRPPWWP